MVMMHAAGVLIMLTLLFLPCRADVDRDTILKAPLWELFQLKGTDALPPALADDAAANREFTINNVMLRAGKDGIAKGSSLPASSGTALASSSAAQLFTLGFR